jgi:hypothetical protein
MKVSTELRLKPTVQGLRRTAQVTEQNTLQSAAMRKLVWIAIAAGIAPGVTLRMAEPRWLVLDNVRVIDVCEARHVPCTAHLELLDARELIAAGLNGIEHVTSLGTSVVGC